MLADTQMPGKTGYDLCLALKSDAKTGDVPVVILVGNGAPYDAAKGTQVGADTNLPKPWDTQTMLEKVTEIVAKGASGVPSQVRRPRRRQLRDGRRQPRRRPSRGGSQGRGRAAANQPPRSATIMGMPTIKLPGGVAPPSRPRPRPRRPARPP